MDHTTRNEQDVDLGVQGLAVVKEHMEKFYGPSVETHPLPVPEDDYTKTWGQESHEMLLRKGVDIMEARKRAMNKFSILRMLGEFSVKVFFTHQVLKAVVRFVSDDGKVQKYGPLAILSVILYRRWTAAPRLNKQLNPPPFVVELPFFGAMLTMAAHREEAHQFIANGIKEGGFKSFEIAVPEGKAFTVLMDVRDREYVLKTNMRNYLKNLENDSASMEFCFGELFGRGIFATDKKEWLDSRKIASHMFSGKNLQKQMEEVFNKHANGVVDMLERYFADKQVTIDIQEVFQCAIFDAFCEIAFGVFPNATESAFKGKKPEFLVAFDFCQKIASERLILPPLVWNLQRLIGHFTGLGNEGKYAQALKVIDDYVYPIIESRLRDANVSQKNDLLSLYINHGRETDQPHILTPEYLRDTVVNYMVAGRDTTSSALNYSMKYVGENPEVEAKLVEKLQPLQGKELITWDDSRQVPYADAVFNEVLRLAPSVGDDFRICNHDDVLPSGIKVKEGTRCFISNIAIGRDPLLWRDPEEFRPERWMRVENGVELPVRRVDEYVHPVFFSGRRLCLGKDMARFESIVFMSKIFNRLKVIPPLEDKGKEIDYSMGPVIFMRKGHKCRIEKRR